MPAPTLVLDFDGTVCLGDGPIWAYAERVLAQLRPTDADRLREALAGYLDRPWSRPDYPDGYIALAALAGPSVPPAVLQDAYLDSRHALADPDLDIYPPDGLADLLDELTGRVRPVVLTNSPPTGLDAAIGRLGLSGRVERVIHSAGKPDRAAELLADLLDGASPSSLCSVGDLWSNDIAPALELGCVTALIDRTGAETRPAHARGRRIQELYPAIREWAADPEIFADRHDPNRPAIPSVTDGSVT